ncbi:hypothetical protein BC629DRAFT_1270708, partial [Irpex lacteus]
LMATLPQVFTRNMEEPVQGEDRLKKGRSVITKIVNALTAKSEIGSPMASMYLLKHADHYTSHMFQRFYWRPYVIIAKNKNGIVGISPVLDYMYRPRKYDQVNLYDWISMSTKTKCGKPTSNNNSNRKSIDDDTSSESEEDSNEDTSDVNSESEDDSSNDTSSNDESSDHSSNNVADNASHNSRQTLSHSAEQAEYFKYDDFLSEHPQYETYKVRMLPKSKAKVPDFIGGALPRYDRGNREEYCMTMLTFFRPWRTGLELKSNDLTWNDEFEKYTFSQQNRNTMKYFNLRYECNDARDDYAAQRRLHNLDHSQWPFDIDSQTTEWLDRHDNNDYTEFSHFDPDDVESYNYSNSALLSLQRMAETEALAEENGLLD